MNNDRRKELKRAAALLEQAQTLADEASQIVTDVYGEEQDIYDGLPENFQNGDRGEAMQAAISALESVELEDVFADALGYIEEAQA